MDRNDWTGALANVHRAHATESLLTVLRFGESGTAAFWGMAASGRTYVIKVLGNPQGDQCLATERIVSAAGNLIGAPVRPVALLDIASTFQREQYVEGRFIPKGVAHGSELLRAAEDGDNLEVHLAKDDNAARVPALMALWDWCLGTDEQWLFDLQSHRAVWSYDHGLWLTGESEWTSETLFRVVDRAWEMTLTFRGDRNAFASVAERLDAVTVDDCLRVVGSVPASWPMSNNDLETVAWLLYRRRSGVAARLRKWI